MTVIYRSDSTDLIITLTSDEPLGVLDSQFVEDWAGVDGQLSIYNEGTFARTAVVMSAVPLETPLVSDDVFRGQKTLASLPDGLYQIQGRVRDLVGNYTILSAFQTPTGGERVITLSFEIRGGAMIPRAKGITVLETFHEIHVVRPIVQVHIPERPFANAVR